MSGAASRALVLAGHGSHYSPDSSAPLGAVACRLRAMGRFDSVYTAFWKEEPSLARVLDAVDARDVTVVPVFMSEGYFTRTVIPREMGLSGAVSCVRGARVRYTLPVGSSPTLAAVIAARAREAGARPNEAVAVLGHGTRRDSNSERNVFEQARRVADSGEFRDVRAVFIDQDPHMSALFDLVEGDVTIVPMFVAEGWHVGQTIPAELALDGPETRRAGRRVRYARPAGTHPALAEVVLALAEGAAAW